MIVDNKILIRVAGRTLKMYRDFGYECNVNDSIEIETKHLSESSVVKVNVECDCCDIQKKISYYSYIINIKNGGYYACNKCKQSKIEKTNLEKYGVRRPIQNREIRKKLEDTNLLKYGDRIATKNQAVINKIVNTNLEKFGFRSSAQHPDIKEKQKKSVLTSLAEKYSYLNPVKMDYEYSIFKCENGHDYEISYINLHNRLKYKTLICTECNPLELNKSGKEIELYNYIKSIYSDEIQTNIRFDNKELDIYLPDLNLGFEFNGLYWHSSEYKDKWYHHSKMKTMNDNNITLFNVWEDDWDYRKEIVKSMISYRLGLIDNKIHSRKCEISYLTNIQQIKDFLNENHLQGYTHSTEKIGIFYDSELVGLMTFIKRKNNWEINRFVVKRQTIVNGAFSKILKTFKEKHKNTTIYTFADSSWSNGNLYSSNGFVLDKILPPDYSYLLNNKRNHKFKFRKNENEIKNKYPKIYNCGLKKYKMDI